MALTPTSSGYSPTIPLDSEKTKTKWHHNLRKWLPKHDRFPLRAAGGEEGQREPGELGEPGEPGDVEGPGGLEGGKQDAAAQPRPGLGRRISRKVKPNLPRPGTFKRQQSERRERLSPVKLAPGERRAFSLDRKRLRAMSARPASPVRCPITSTQARSVYEGPTQDRGSIESFPRMYSTQSNDTQQNGSQANDRSAQRPAPPLSPPPDLLDDGDYSTDTHADDRMRRELEEKWILNLSMHFRDRSPREKFFVTYAETPTRWRRVTVSIDYRDAPPDSLERDLQDLQFHRDKSARIYEAIRTSLPDIQFYDTVTNLRLETSHDDRLHVHVTEDVNEIIRYPSLSAVNHLRPCRQVRENDVHFVSHMSGFVYKVRVDDRVCIKKEIPGPDSVEEFLYEINALHELIGSRNVIQFEGLVIDGESGLVKGLLIGFAENGPLVDLLYDEKGRLPWERRQRWAHQIVNGLSEIHEAGYVQGDFTLSNIVIDEEDTARIIDINRRGCPVGWEPPEIARKIESGQRISMCIGVKSDLFQLGMVLWAIAEEEDEPERQHRPLTLQYTTHPVPQWYRELTHRCLSDSPRDRLSAVQLLSYFEKESGDGLPLFDPQSHRDSIEQSRSRSRPRQTVTEYIDPDTAVGHDDLPIRRTFSADSRRYSDSHTYIDRPPSSMSIPFDNESSYMVPRRGRTPPINTSHLDYPSWGSQGFGMSATGGTQLDPQIVPVSPSGNAHRYEISLGNRSLFVNEPPEGQPRESGQADYFQQDDFDGDFSQPLGMSHVDSGFVDAPSPITRRRPPSFYRSSRLRGIEHIDSGLADMELAGVGENDALTGYAKQEPHIGGAAPEDLTIEEEEKADDAESAGANLSEPELEEPDEKAAIKGLHFTNDSQRIQDFKARATSPDTEGDKEMGDGGGGVRLVEA